MMEACWDGGVEGGGTGVISRMLAREGEADTERLRNRRDSFRHSDLF